MKPIFTQNSPWMSFCEFAQFSKQPFARLKSKHFSQFFWWEVNLRGLRGFILQKVQASVVERQKKKFCYPSFNFGKEDTIIRIVSVWDRSCYSTHRIFFLEHKMRPIVHQGRRNVYKFVKKKHMFYNVPILIICQNKTLILTFRQPCTYQSLKNSEPVVSDNRIPSKNLR